jgi:Flp pilus assembly protein TadG
MIVAGKSPNRRPRRTGAVVVELAVLLPFLSFCFVVALDYCRIFYYIQAVQNGAETGALYACQNSTTAGNTSQIVSTAQADMSDLSPTPKVISAQGTDADGNATVTVTVSYTFTTITNYPGVPSSTKLTRTVTARVCPP